MLYESDRLRLILADGVATLWLDNPATGNTLSLPFLRDLERAIATARNSPAVDLLVIRSAVAGVFAGGPDLDEVSVLDDEASRREYAAAGQRVFQSLAEAGNFTTTLAFIDGPCRDAGLELALACRHRMAVARPNTAFEFSLRRRGLPPCWGGTHRLVQQVGLLTALEMMAGQAVSARRAAQIGLIDRAIGARAARTELLWFLSECQDRGSLRVTWSTRWRLTLEAIPWIRNSWIQKARQAAADDAVVAGAVAACVLGHRNGAAEGEAAERKLLAQLSDNVESLRRISDAARSGRYLRGCSATGLPRRVALTATSDDAVALAALALQAGCFVQVPSGSHSVVARLRGELQSAAAAGWINALEISACVSRIVTREENCGDPIDMTIADGEGAVHATSEERPVRTTGGMHVELHNDDGSGVGLKIQLQPPAGVGGAVRFLSPNSADPRGAARFARWAAQCGLHLTDAPQAAELPRRAVFAA